MMSEEEKKAIESLRKNRGVSFAQADIISNLIDKQQKEIEEMREELQMYVDTNLMKQRVIQEILSDNWVSKDKIREKIKEYSNDKYEFLVARENIITILNELLEE